MWTMCVGVYTVLIKCICCRRLPIWTYIAVGPWTTKVTPDQLSIHQNARPNLPTHETLCMFTCRQQTAQVRCSCRALLCMYVLMFTCFFDAGHVSNEASLILKDLPYHARYACRLDCPHTSESIQYRVHMPTISAILKQDACMFLLFLNNFFSHADLYL